MCISERERERERVHLHMGTYRGQNSEDLELETVMSYPTWVRRTKLRTSERTAHPLTAELSL